jgi:hypothetical protein
MLLVMSSMLFLMPSSLELWLLSRHMVLRPCSSVCEVGGCAIVDIYVFRKRNCFLSKY